MRILVIGAYGFIGSAVTARLSADGHEVVGAGRRIGRASRTHPDLRWIRFNLARKRTSEQWHTLLSNIDAVVNCAGVLQDKPGDSTQKVHVAGTAALFEACVREGVRRVVHLSAAGVAHDGETRFARTKFASEEALKQRNLDWIILRPSLVVGSQVYGGTAFIRALAAIPYVLPIARESASFQPVQVKELAAAVAFFLKPEAPVRRVVEIAGPERLSLLRIISLYRRWLGLAPAEVIRLPMIAARAAAWAGDVVSWLGWRPPLRTTALRQLMSARADDPDEWTRLTGIKPTRLETALLLDPASAPDRWFARLYLLKPIIIATLSLFWIASGVIGLGPARGIVADLLKEVGFGPWSHVAVIASEAIHLAVGAGIALRSTARAALTASLVVAVVYVAAGSLMRIGLWFDPLGALIKMFPLIVLTVVALAILDDR